MAVTADRVVVELEARLDRYESNVARAESKFDKAMSGIQKSAKVTEQIVSRAALAMGTVLGSIGFIALGKQAVDTALRFRRFEQGLAIAVGSAQKAGEEISFLRDLADRLGLRFITLAENFSGFAAAARGTSLEGERAREIFESVTKAIVATGGSMEQVNGALLAVQQMISKGNVSADELRGQLGERLPGAFQIASRAMGVTTAELGKMLEQGDVAADVFLPKFAAQLGKELPDALQTADASFQRFQTALDDIANSTADGFMKQLGDATDDLTKTLKDMQNSGALEAIGSFLGTVIRLGGDAARVIGDLALSWRKYRLEVGIKQQSTLENAFFATDKQRAEARRNRQALEAELEMANNPRVARFRSKLAALPESANDGRPSPGSPPAPGGGSSSSKSDQKKREAAARRAAQEAERAAREQLQREQEDRQIQIELLRAQSALTDNIEAKAQFEREMLEIEKQQRLADLAADKGLSAEQRKARLTAIQRLYGGGGTEGGEITVDGGGLLPRAVSRELGKQLEEAANMRAEADFDIAREALEGQERLATTRAERERIQLELLKLDFEERRRQLERQRDNAASDAERDAYQARIDALPSQQGAAEKDVRRGNMGALDRYADSLTNADTEQQIEALVVQELDYVRDGIHGAISKRLGVKDPLLAGIIDIFIQQNIMRPIAEALANSGGGGGIGGLIGGIGAVLGFAGGGSGVIGGRGGTDTNILSLNGRPFANVSRGETLSVGSKALGGRSGAQVVQPIIQVDARGAVMNDEFARMILAQANQGAIQAASAMGNAINRGIPTRLAKYQRDGT